MNTPQEECDHGWITPPECPQCIAQERDQLRAENALLRTLATAVENRQSILAEYGCWGILEALSNLAAKGVKL
jgi:hypothetical protein